MLILSAAVCAVIFLCSHTGTVRADVLETDAEETAEETAPETDAEETESSTETERTDTVPPAGEVRDLTVSQNDSLTPDDLIVSVTDETDVTLSFREEPALAEGENTVTVVLTDEAGNTAELTACVTLVIDEEAPVIDGVAPLTGFIDVPISYKSEITVTDNYDEKPELTVDTSRVDTLTAGIYPVTYTATDWAGNTATASTTITISEKPENYVEESVVLEMAQEVLDEITDENMTVKEVARAIYDWSKENISYEDSSEKDSWTNGAYQGFTLRSGDCFIYFSACKALLTQAGIPNLDVVKSDTSESRHYWSLVNCGDGWYHFDTTPRRLGGEFFMLTDAEILEYSESHGNSHIFDTSLYPATPTEPFSMDD